MRMYMFVELYIMFRYCRVLVSASRYDLANRLNYCPLLEQRSVSCLVYYFTN